VLGLTVIVQDEIVTHPADETQFPGKCQFPRFSSDRAHEYDADTQTLVYGTKTLHPEITLGKAGGVSIS
jgi:hypothetical protein